MATTSTNKQPLLIDRVFHIAIEGNTLTSGSDTDLDIVGTNQSAILVDCTANDGGIVEDLYTIARTTSSTSYKVLFYLSSSVDYLRPGEGVYIGSVDTDTTADVKTQYITKVVNVMRRIYRDMWIEYEQKGIVPSKYQNSKYF